MKIVKKSVDSLIPYVNNARTHSQEQITQIAASIKEFGFNNPILLDKDNGIIAGHGRLAAAKLLGFTEVPTIELPHLSESQRKAFILADNRISLSAGWDEELLSLELKALEDTNFDLTLLGFTDDEIQLRLNPELIKEGQADDDEVPEVEAAIVSKVGDIWVLGDHRLMCADSTMVDNVTALLNGHKPNLMVTDPPYGVNYDPSWRDDCDLGVGERSRGKVINDDKADWTETYALFTGDVAYVWHAGKYSDIVAKNLQSCDFEIISQIIWVKQHFALSRGDYHWQHEPCWYVVRKGKKHRWLGGRDQATTWQIKNNNSFGNPNAEERWGHGTQKPMDCMLKPILNHTKPKEYVYDPFGGSGTTLLACEKSGRRCLMAELDPKYADVIIRRWQKFTGQQAILESNGQTFDQLSL